MLASDFSVLIVEDDDDARSNMVDILSLDDYTIETASHCLPAIEAVEQRNFDAVIVDWKLPDGDASNLLPIIFAHQPDTPVIVVTGYREFDVAVTALREGAYDFLLKPINPDALRAVLHRVVERTENLRKLEAAQRKLLMNERLAAIGQMVAGLAHESRNAFQRSHACLANLALDVAKMPESLELVHKVQKALDDLNLLLDEVRDYSAPINLERQATDLRALVNETWQHTTAASQSETEPEFRLQCADGFPGKFAVDRNRIQQVIRNLLENARHACADSGVVEARLLLQDQPPGVRIEIEDSGSGVLPDQAARVFEPFFTTKTKGTGLGLAICRRIVEVHDGRIGLGSGALGGACFVVELPSTKKV
ncbi:MAG: sensor histidine kinase [Pirellulaceae bacterium]